MLSEMLFLGFKIIVSSCQCTINLAFGNIEEFLFAKSRRSCDFDLSASPISGGNHWLMLGIYFGF